MIYANILDRITEGRTLPDGCDRWALKATDFAGRTRGGFQWPDHGVVSLPAEGLVRSNTRACPIREGDGLCVGLTYRGIAMGGHRAFALLLVAYAQADVLGQDPDKVRLARVTVVERLDGERVLRDHGAEVDLYGAYLGGAYLYGADLRGANLYGADLYGADLRGAYLYGANLYGANLYGADLRGANLYRADLGGADLDGARHDVTTRWPDGFTPPGGAA